jgi:prevent-host-death family protein
MTSSLIATLRSTMADRTIPLRELRNDVSAILRAVESEGATFTITVRGKPVARLTPAIEEPGPRRSVPADEVRRIFADIPVDPTWLPELLEMRAEDDEDDTWPEFKQLP